MYTHLYSACLDLNWFSLWLSNVWPTGGQNTRERDLSRAPHQLNFFWAFCLHVLRLELETWNLYLISRAIIRLEFHHNSVTLTYFTAKDMSKSFSSFMASNSFRAFRFGTRTYIASALTRTDFRHGWVIFAPPPPLSFLSLFFYRFLYMNLKLGIYMLFMAQQNKLEFHRNQVSLTHFTTKNKSHYFFYTWLHQLYECSKCGTYTYKVSLLASIDFCYSWAIVGSGGIKHSEVVDQWLDHLGFLPPESFPDSFLNASISQLVYTLSSLDNISSSYFIRMGSLSPISCS